jgi:hypothetical protein
LPLQRPRRVGATENSVCRRITVYKVKWLRSFCAGSRPLNS